MTTTTQKPDHRSLPRQKHAPSERDQAIFLAYRTQGRTQTELATDHRVSQRRISQIIHRVQRWLADSAPVGCVERSATHLGSLDHDQLQRLERHLQRERAQAVFDRSLRAHDRGIQELKTTRHGKRGNTSFEETVTREVLPSPQFLRLAIQANRDLASLADKPASPVGWAVPTTPPVGCVESAAADETHQAPCDADARWQQTLSSLYQARQQAEDEHKVTQGHGHLDYLGTVKHWLDALLGNRPDYFHPEDISSGTPLHELATFYLGRPRSPNPDPALNPDLAPNPTPSNPSTASNLALPEELPSESQLEPASDLTPFHARPDSPAEPNDSSVLRTEYSVPGTHPRAPSLRPAPSTPSSPPHTPHSALLPEPRVPSGCLNPYRYHLDDYGYQPTPQSKEDEAQMVQDYLAKLRAERLANA